MQERARTLPGATGAPAVVSEDGTAATVFIPVTTKDAVETADVVTDLRADAKADLPEGLTAQVTGPAAIQADLAAVFDGANFRLLAATASVVAMLLVITYRSPFLWLVPLAVVGVADQLAAVLATHTPRRLRRALGRVDDRHPLGAGLRRRHRLRPAAHLPLPRRAAGHRRTGARRWPSPCGAPPRPCSPARPPSCSACSPCCCRSSRPPAGSAWPAPSASSWPRPSCWSCSAGRPGRLRALDLLAEGAARGRDRPGRRPARSGAGSATPSRSAPRASSPSPSSCWASWRAA